MDRALATPAWIANYRAAHAAVCRGHTVIMHGGWGTGKTRCAAEVARSYDSRDSLYVTAMDFFMDIRATYKRDSDECERDVVGRLADCPLLVLDELHLRSDSLWENNLLTCLVDRRYRNELPTILVSNLSVEGLVENIGPAIIDRVNGAGLRLEFAWPSFRRK